MDDKTKKEILDIKYDFQAIEYLISIMLTKKFYFKHNTRALTVFDEFREEIKDDLINLPIGGSNEFVGEEFRGDPRKSSRVRGDILNSFAKL